VCQLDEPREVTANRSWFSDWVGTS
jgi:hypothetical protein